MERLRGARAKRQGAKRESRQIRARVRAPSPTKSITSEQVPRNNLRDVLLRPAGESVDSGKSTLSDVAPTWRLVLLTGRGPSEARPKGLGKASAKAQ